MEDLEAFELKINNWEKISGELLSDGATPNRDCDIQKVARAQAVVGHVVFGGDCTQS